MRRKTTRDIKSRHNDCVISNSSGKKNRITEKKETKLSKSLVSRVIITNFHSIYFEGGKGRVSIILLGFVDGFMDDFKGKRPKVVENYQKVTHSLISCKQIELGNCK